MVQEKKRNRRARPVKTLAELVAMPDDYMASVDEAAAYIGVTAQCVYHSVKIYTHYTKSKVTSVIFFYKSN